jgi:hypothetical protein
VRERDSPGRTESGAADDGGDVSHVGGSQGSDGQIGTAGAGRVLTLAATGDCRKSCEGSEREPLGESDLATGEQHTDLLKSSSDPTRSLVNTRQRSRYERAVVEATIRLSTRPPSRGRRTMEPLIPLWPFFVPTPHPHNQAVASQRWARSGKIGRKEIGVCHAGHIAGVGIAHDTHDCLGVGREVAPERTIGSTPAERLCLSWTRNASRLALLARTSVLLG